VRLTSPFGTSATVGLLYQPRMIDDADYKAVGGMRIGRGNRSTRRKPAPVPLCLPQIPHDLTWDRTSPEVRRPGRQADHSPPSSAEVKNDRALSPLPHTPSWFGP
jgi:hypothetical protein